MDVQDAAERQASGTRPDRNRPRSLTACMANLDEARAALSLIRQVVEELARPGSVPDAERLTPEFNAEAEAIIAGIQAIAAVRKGAPPSPVSATGPEDRQ